MHVCKLVLHLPIEIEILSSHMWVKEAIKSINLEAVVLCLSQGARILGHETVLPWNKIMHTTRDTNLAKCLLDYVYRVHRWYGLTSISNNSSSDDFDQKIKNFTFLAS